MPDIDLKIDLLYDILQRYECTNRITKAVIRMVRIKFNIGKMIPKTGVYISCQTHKETLHCKNKTDAINMMRKPWVWCDECAAIHFNTVWQLDPNVRRGTHTHRCDCFLEEKEDG